MEYFYTFIHTSPIYIHRAIEKIKSNTKINWLIKKLATQDKEECKHGNRQEIAQWQTKSKRISIWIKRQKCQTGWKSNPTYMKFTIEAF